MSSPLSPTLHAQRRAWLSWFEDGLPSIVASAGCLLMAFFLLFPRGKPNSLFSLVMFFTTLFLYAAILLRHREIVDWLKTRITYPRVGYVNPPDFAADASLPSEFTVLSTQDRPVAQEEAPGAFEGRKKQFWLALVIALTAIWAGMFIRTPWICFLVGLLMAVGFWLFTRDERRVSWIVLAGLPLAGFCLSIFLPPATAGPARLAYLLACGGLLLFLDGSVSLVRFLRRHPRPSSTGP